MTAQRTTRLLEGGSVAVGLWQPTASSAAKARAAMSVNLMDQ
jgi:hypothetical protein